MIIATVMAMLTATVMTMAIAIVIVIATVTLISRRAGDRRTAPVRTRMRFP